MIVDEFGIKHKTSSELKTLPWYLEGPIKTVEDLDNYEMPDPHAPGRLSDIKAILKKVGDEMVVATNLGTLAGPLTGAWFLSVPSVILRSLIDSPKFAKRLLELSAGFCLEIGKQVIDEGIQVIFIAEDLGDVHGPFASPEILRRHIFPLLTEMTNEFKRRGAKVLLHCDGNVNVIMDDLVRIGIDGYHPMERKCQMDIQKLKREYGEEICLIGNVDASNLLPLGSYKQIAEQIEECVTSAAPSGGYIFASDHSIHPGVPGDRAKFLFKTAEKHRSYARHPASP